MLSSLNDMSIRSGSKKHVWLQSSPFYPLVIQQMETYPFGFHVFFPSYKTLYLVSFTGGNLPSQQTKKWHRAGCYFSYPKPGDSVRILDLFGCNWKRLTSISGIKFGHLFYLYIYIYINIFISEPGPNRNHRKHQPAGIEAWLREELKGPECVRPGYDSMRKIEGCPKNQKTFDWDKNDIKTNSLRYTMIYLEYRIQQMHGEDWKHT